MSNISNFIDKLKVLISDSIGIKVIRNIPEERSKIHMLIEIVYISIIFLLEVLYMCIYIEKIWVGFIFLLLNIVLIQVNKESSKFHNRDFNREVCYFLIKGTLVFLWDLMKVIPVIFLICKVWLNKVSWDELKIIFMLVVIVLLVKWLLSFAFKRNIGLIEIMVLYLIIFSFSYLKLWSVIISYLGYKLIDWLASKKSLYYFYKMSKPLEKSKPVKFDVDPEMELFWENKKSEVLFIVIAINITVAIRENMTVPVFIKDFIYNILCHDQTNITMVVSLSSVILFSFIYVLIKCTLKYPVLSDKIPVFSSAISQQKIWANSKQITEDKSNKSEK